ncbi:MAG: hypothetical protein DHS20C16_37530 [Phycisphaerae bacterium]|nr:MAG: hypothetical protein DHS20C16_37530 [Phycisphaerae bacterium]
MSTPPEQTPVLYRRSTVLFLIFVAAGVLTIPIIWRSPAFGRTEKIFWSIVAAAYSAAVIILLIVILVMMYRLTFRPMDIY